MTAGHVCTHLAVSQTTNLLGRGSGDVDMRIEVVRSTCDQTNDSGVVQHEDRLVVGKRGNATEAEGEWIHEIALSAPI